MRTRVIRILEYTYPDVDTMQQDMEHWTTRLRRGQAKRGMTMRSTHFLPTFTDDDICACDMRHPDDDSPFEHHPYCIVGHHRKEREDEHDD